ncbi:trans-aconitate 2-methyltransferase [Krasilnikovia cinnamomea]|uniref:Trans-aconitate 2-methyltransferase n=1 Tax=Krasilnikovia cinnamomea TaxID=349313 RepID=A0A4Q7ZEB5_9ACTN|nr:trans-aconitate 2-methyltransferase [Krasilnikovia cinnamomea]RZU49027.1 trans-aconitate 2-methyltransferase [Krasilnikovia cinnamomea]
MWDPAVYRRFGAERSRPFADLLARVAAEAPRAVVDLGCGSGELTATLAQRWPSARVTGLDSSPEMIERAVALGAPADFRVADVRAWRPGPDDDVVISNAVLQWVPGHDDLLRRWVRELPPGAWLAVQVPGNFDAPSHRALREVARSTPWADRLGGLLREAPVDDAPGYARVLTDAGATVDAWETTYVHLLPADPAAAHPVLRWMEGTALRPVRAALDDAAWQEFRAALGERLAAAYPARGGLVAFPFRRVFAVATTPKESPQ